MQKAIVTITIALLIGILCLNLLVWLAASGSSHNIPVKTQWWFATNSAILITIIFLFFRYRKRISNRV